MDTENNTGPRRQFSHDTGMYYAQLRQICQQNSIVWQIFWQLLQIKVGALWKCLPWKANKDIGNLDGRRSKDPWQKLPQTKYSFIWRFTTISLLLRNVKKQTWCFFGSRPQFEGGAKDNFEFISLTYQPCDDRSAMWWKISNVMI